MTLSSQQQQRIQRLAFRLAQDSDESYDDAVKRITECVLDIVDIERRPKRLTPPGDGVGTPSTHGGRAESNITANLEFSQLTERVRR